VVVGVVGREMNEEVEEEEAKSAATQERAQDLTTQPTA